MARVRAIAAMLLLVLVMTWLNDRSLEQAR